MPQSPRKRLRLTGSVLAVFLVCAAVAASATVYQFFYVNATGTVRTPDLTLAAGGDASGSCTVYPCATVGISGTSDTATVALSLFKADATFTPPPSTYYTDLVEIKDATNTHHVTQVTVTNIASTSGSDFGKVIVYYCTTQCTFDSTGAVTGGTSAGSFSITSTAGGSVFSGSQSISAGA
ncbi:MAG TPA: hypothetical protein VJR06_04885, partial [Nitrososphaerales archaeon]|nr:hypothetical protein [Nitrososphaerales archaeon]